MFLINQQQVITSTPGMWGRGI